MRRAGLMLLLILLVAAFACTEFRQPEEQNAPFANRCSTCHSLERSLALTKEPFSWRGTVERMADKKPESISLQQQREIIGYLVACCSPPVDDLFRARCGICHDTTALQQQALSAYEWAYMADVCRSRLSQRIGLDESQRIAAWLAGAEQGTLADPFVTTGEDILSALNRGPENDAEHLLLACGKCHTSAKLTRVYTAEQWTVILERMVSKNPAWLTPQRMEPVGRYVTACAEEGRAAWPLTAGQTLLPNLESFGRTDTSRESPH